MRRSPDRAELRIESIGARGDGITHLGGRRIYVPFTLPGEWVVAELTGERGDGLAARALEWLVTSPERVAAPCPHFGSCGGCALQHWSDPGYARWKIELLRTMLSRQGLDPPIEPLRRTPPGARRRAGFVLRFGGRGTKLGYRERASHRLVSIQRCPVLRPSLERLTLAAPAALADLAAPDTEWALDASDTDSGIDLLVTMPEAPGLAARQALAALADALDLARVSWRRGEKAESEPIAVRRQPVLTFAGVTVMPPPGCFFQASAEGEAALTTAVMEMTAGAKRLAELYCGVGTFTIPLAGRGAKVLAVDGVGEAVAALADAARKARLAIRSLKRDLARTPLTGAELEDFDTVVLDPPRAGAKAQSAALAASRVPVVVAVSCNPATFARDARLLVAGGYRLERVAPVDQFLWSPHLEVVGLFRR